MKNKTQQKQETKQTNKQTNKQNKQTYQKKKHQKQKQKQNKTKKQKQKQKKLLKERKSPVFVKHEWSGNETNWYLVWSVSQGSSKPKCHDLYRFLAIFLSA